MVLSEEDNQDSLILSQDFQILEAAAEDMAAADLAVEAAQAL
jgi:hypothetical protein